MRSDDRQSSNKCLIVWHFRKYLRIYYCNVPYIRSLAWRTIVSLKVPSCCVTCSLTFAIWFRQTNPSHSCSVEGLCKGRQYIKCFHLISFALTSSVQLSYFELCFCWFFLLLNNNNVLLMHSFCLPVLDPLSSIKKAIFFNWIFHKCLL